MQVGLLLVFQNFMDKLSDAQIYQQELHLAGLAEPLGFDILSSAEHHFFNYSMAPDNVQILSYLAGKSTRIKLLTGAVILPWNNPLRVVERMILLDHMSKGRALFGIGRGLAQREYARFGVEMNEARDRFDEAAEIILRGLETGIVEADGQYYQQPRTTVRPAPLKSFRDRFYSVAMSSDSVPVCARLGARMLTFAQKPWDQMLPHFDTYRSLYEQAHKRPAPSPVCVDFMCCDESAERAELLAREHMANYYVTVMEHYDMAGEHFAKLKGYGDYATTAEMIRAAGMEAAGNAFVDINTWGTPKQILDKLEARRRVLGDFDLFCEIIYGGMSVENAEKSMRTFAQKVLPELRSWRAAA
ncbi:MAG: LLM class flavin-dependent oxidoreductase [Gammaproteobacteria bacterium]